MNVVNKSVSVAFLIVLFVLSGCGKSVEVSQKQPEAQVSAVVEAPAEVASVGKKIYSSEKHHFSFQYPASWEIINKEGVIITANDERDAWGGTNLNLQYDFTAGGVLMEWKEIKKSEEVINKQGVKYALSFYGQDWEFYKNNELKNEYNSDLVRIFVDSDLIPGLVIFSYNKKVNPDGEQQLRDILNTLTSTAGRASGAAYDAYKKWTLSPEILAKNSADWRILNQTDCVGLFNGRTEGGDLLSSMIADHEKMAGLTNLKTFTADYVLKLENSIVAYANKKYDKDFYAFSVCHLADGIDVVAGDLWPKGEQVATLAEKEKMSNAGLEANIKKNAAKGAGLMIVNNGKVMGYDDIQLISNTATGAEASPCKGKLVGKAVVWACFQGLHGDSKNGIDGSKMAEWTIPLDGGKVVKREYVEKV